MGKVTTVEIADPEQFDKTIADYQEKDNVYVLFFGARKDEPGRPSWYVFCVLNT